MSVSAFTENELLIVLAARELAKVTKEDPTVFTGFGMPQAVAKQAFDMGRSNLRIIFEFGAIAVIPEYPLVRNQMGGPRGSYKAEQWTDMETVFNYAACGHINVGLLGTAQIDQFGNANTTMIGEDYDSPDVRLPGSGGANEVGALCRKTIFVCSHDGRKFVKELDFRTVPGYLDGSPRARESAGLPPNTGPFRVVTTKAIFCKCAHFL